MDGDSLDTLLNNIGLGKWQILVLITNFINWYVLSPNTMGATLVNAPVSFNCFGRQELTVMNRSLPEYSIIGATLSINRFIRNISFENNCFNEETQQNYSELTTIHNVSLTSLPSCPYIHYDTSIFASTVNTEWNLICENEYKRTFYQDAFVIGQIFGGIIGGPVGDRYGRAKVVLFASFLHTICACTIAVTTNFLLLIISRFFLGFTGIMNVITGVTLALEICPEKSRGAIGMLIGSPFSIGIVIFASVGTVLRDWRYLYISTCFPVLLITPFACFIDESPRWLLQNGKRKSAERILKKAAIMNSSSNNNKKIDIQLSLESIIQNSKEEVNNKKKTIHIISVINSIRKYPKMVRIHIVSPIAWCLNEIIYYGTIFSANTFAKQYTYAFIGLIGVADLFAILSGMLCVKYLGRRTTVAGNQYLSGLMMILVLVTPEAYKWLQWLFVLVGFFMCAVASQVLYIYTPELFPTSSRATGFAISNIAACTGTLVAPFIPEYLVIY